MTRKTDHLELIVSKAVDQAMAKLQEDITAIVKQALETYQNSPSRCFDYQPSDDGEMPPVN